MDYDALAACLIRRVRGTLSKGRLSRRLGFASNVVHLWERGQRLPDVETFFRIARMRRQPFSDGLAALLDAAPRRPEAGAALAARELSVSNLMRLACGQRSMSELARASGFDRATIARWCEGKTTPRLPDFLEFLDKATHRLLDFVALFADPRHIEPTRPAYEEHQKKQRIAYGMPWSSAILHALELTEYQALEAHDPQLLARKLGIGEEEVERLLRELEEARLVERRDGRYRPARIMTVNTQGDFAANRRLKRHWAAVASSRLERFEPDQQSLFSYNVFPIARADLARLRQLHLDYYQRVRELVATASGADHVVLMNVQLCVLEEARAGSR